MTEVNEAMMAVLIVSRKLPDGGFEVVFRRKYDWNDKDNIAAADAVVRQAIQNGFTVKLYRPGRQQAEKF